MALFKPTWFKKTFQEITIPFLQENGIEVVLTDLDNTLIGWDEKEIDENLLAWVRSLKEAGCSICVSWLEATTQGIQSGTTITGV